MDPNFWALVVAQLPALAGGFTALQRGWLYLGATIDQERKARAEADAKLAVQIDARIAELIAENERERQRTADAVADRKSAEMRMQFATEAMKAATDEMERAGKLTERLFERIVRDPEARERASDRPGAVSEEAERRGQGAKRR